MVSSRKAPAEEGGGQNEARFEERWELGKRLNAFFALNVKFTPDLETPLYFPPDLIWIFIWDHQFLLTIKHIIITVKHFYDTFI